MTEDLLVAAEGEPDVPGGAATVGQERLDGADGRDELALVVEGAAAPEQTVDDLAGQRRMGPARLVTDRHDVEVGHEDDRRLAVGLAGRVGGDPDEQPVRVDVDDLLGHDEGEASPQHLVGGDEGGRVGLSAGRCGNRRQAEELLECGEGVRGDRHAP